MWKPIPIEFEKNQKVNCMRIFFRKVIQNKFFYVAQKWTHFQRTGKWSEMDLEGLPGGSGWTQTKFKFRVIQNPPFTNINYNISTKLLVIEISWFKLTKKKSINWNFICIVWKSISKGLQGNHIVFFLTKFNSSWILNKFNFQVWQTKNLTSYRKLALKNWRLWNPKRNAKRIVMEYKPPQSKLICFEIRPILFNEKNFPQNIFRLSTSHPTGSWIR